MSDARAIEAVTETLRGIVDAGVKLVAPGGRAVTQPPHDITPGQELRVNLFLYQAEVDAALRNTDPVGISPGERGQPALPLILHYLVTPYAPDADDVQAHRLLGGALQALHSHPVLSGRDLADAAPYSDISHQVESVRICWQPLADKDIYALWSIFQAPYRISVAVEVRVVLIDSTAAAAAPLPVLSRGSTGRGPVVGASVELPEITEVLPRLGQPAALPGEQVTVRGTALDADAVTVLLDHRLLPAPLQLAPDSARADQVVFTVPADPPAGFGTVSLRLVTAGTSDRLTNEAGLAIGPAITSALPAAAAAGDTLTVDVVPTVRAGQQVCLVLAGAVVTGAPVDADTTSLDFPLGATAAGQYPLRLRVDGVDSRLVADRTAVPPGYDPAQAVTIT